MSQRQALRVVLDTSALFAYLHAGGHARLADLLTRDGVVLLTSAEHLGEMEDVFQRPKRRGRVSEADLARFWRLFMNKCEVIEVRAQLTLCRDAKDDYLLALAKDGQADLLITRDKDLLVLDPFGDTRIVTPGVGLPAL